MIGRLLGGFVCLGIGLSLLPVISKQVNQAANVNVSGFGSTILGLVPAFFALAIAGIGIAVTYSGLRSAGFVGGGTEGGLETAVVDSENTHHDITYTSFNPIRPKKTILTTPHTEYKRVYTDEGGKFD